MRQDLQLNRSLHDLEYPTTGANRLPDSVFERAIKRKYDVGIKPSFSPESKKYELLAEMIDRAKNDGREIVFVLAPIHPAAYNYQNEDYFVKAREVLRKLGREHNVTVIDALDIVPGELYSDALHPMDAGAKLVSNHVASELTKLLRTSEPGK